MGIRQCAHPMGLGAELGPKLEVRLVALMARVVGPADVEVEAELLLDELELLEASICCCRSI